jgi:hypothetical protein
MPLSARIPEGGTFFCPHCGALYSVTHSRLSKSESNIAKCVVCLQIMEKVDSTNIPTYKLTATDAGDPVPPVRRGQCQAQKRKPT